MDSITHIALGACIGEALLGKKLGRTAMLLGAISQSLPDIDFIAGFWLDTPDELLAHRGITHSITGVLFASFLLAWFAYRGFLKKNIPYSRWLFFIGLELFVHLFIDAFNNYGVGWFEPFNNTRISFNILYVADPFFSIWPGIAAIVLLFVRNNFRRRTWWWRFGVFLCIAYLFYASINKYYINSIARESISSQQLPMQRYFTTPTPLNNWLWMIVTGDDNGFHVGYRSVFDSPGPIQFTYFPRNQKAVKDHLDDPGLPQLLQFSQGFYTVEERSDTLVFNDLRFGQVIGWQRPREEFAFHFYLHHASGNELVVQRGRFARWDWNSFRFFLRRIAGKKSMTAD